MGGRVNSYIANPTFDPVAVRVRSTTGTAATPVIRRSPRPSENSSRYAPSTRTATGRLQVMDEQGVAGMLLFPTLGVGTRGSAPRRSRGLPPRSSTGSIAGSRRTGATASRGASLAVPYIPFLDPETAAAELQRRARPRCRRGQRSQRTGSRARRVPIAVRSGLRPFWGLAEEAGVVVATHAGVDGYDALVQMWEPGGSRELAVPIASPRGRHQGPGGLRLLRRRAVPSPLRTVPRAPAGQRRERRSWIPELLHRLDDAANRNPGLFRRIPS